MSTTSPEAPDIDIPDGSETAAGEEASEEEEDEIDFGF